MIRILYTGMKYWSNMIGILIKYWWTMNGKWMEWNGMEYLWNIAWYEVLIKHDWLGKLRTKIDFSLFLSVSLWINLFVCRYPHEYTYDIPIISHNIPLYPHYTTIFVGIHHAPSLIHGYVVAFQAAERLASQEVGRTETGCGGNRGSPKWARGALRNLRENNLKTQSLATFDRVSGGLQVWRCFNLFQCVFQFFSTHVLELWWTNWLLLLPLWKHLTLELGTNLCCNPAISALQCLHILWETQRAHGCPWLLGISSCCRHCWLRCADNGTHSWCQLLPPQNAK